MNDRKPVDEVIQSPTISEEQKSKLKLINEVKSFSEEQLGLKKTKNYQHFVQLQSPYVSYLLTVSKKNELKAFEWYFPIVGHVPYKGFPSPEEAAKEALEFPQKGYDTFIRGASAYSTLGWFSDPILSSMLSYNKKDLVDLIIHESVHATLFIKSEAEFNERLASFIGFKGAQEFYIKMEGQDSENVKWLKDENHDDILFSEFLQIQTQQLSQWYKAHNDIDEQQRKKRLNQLKFEFKKNILPQLKTKKYLWFMEQEINNAFLVGLTTYNLNFSLFEKALSKEGSLRAFIEFCKSLEDSKSPQQDLIKHYQIEEPV